MVALDATGSLALATDWILVHDREEAAGVPAAGSEPSPSSDVVIAQAEAVAGGDTEVSEESPRATATPEMERTTASAAWGNMTPEPRAGLNNEWESLVDELTGMGFQQDSAQSAAQEAIGDLKCAVRLLVSRERKGLVGAFVGSDW